MRKLRVGLTVMLLLVMLPRTVHATHPHDRNGFMLGFGVGGGSVGIEDGGDREGSVMANLRIGYCLRPNLALHYEGNGWTKTFDSSQGDVTWTFSTNTAALTLFPSGNGLFLRGGIGIGTATVELETGGVKVSADESGVGFLLAAGWEWRLTKMFALGPQVEYSYQDLDELGHSDIIGGELVFNWYW